MSRHEQSPHRSEVSWFQKEMSLGLERLQQLPSQQSSAERVFAALAGITEKLKEARNFEAFHPRRGVMCGPRSEYSLRHEVEVFPHTSGRPGVCCMHALPTGNILVGTAHAGVSVVTFLNSHDVRVDHYPNRGEVRYLQGLPSGEILFCTTNEVKILRNPSADPVVLREVREGVARDPSPLFQMRSFDTLPDGSIVGCSLGFARRWRPHHSGGWEHEDLFTASDTAIIQALPGGRFLRFDGYLCVMSPVDELNWVAESVTGIRLNDFIALRNGDILGFNERMVHLFSPACHGGWGEKAVEVLPSDSWDSLVGARQLGEACFVVATGSSVSILTIGNNEWRLKRVPVALPDRGRIRALNVGPQGEIIIAGHSIEEIRTDNLETDYGYGWVQLYA